MGSNADAIEEGLAIAHAAARLAVKNRILVSTISLNEPFEPGHFIGDAKAALTDLAEESERGADALRRLRRRAWGRYTEARGTHDYRGRDVRNLKRRAKQSEGVAEALRAELDSDDAVLKLVEQARAAAWEDVSATLQSRLRVEAMRPEQDPEYEKMRAARMQALRLVDLQKLSATTKDRRAD